MTIDNFQLTMDNYLKLIEEALVINGDSPLKEVMQYSLNAGGKRIRPILTLAFGGTPKIAAAIEILHTSTLIQDDLPCMDDDDERRGKPACHKAFSEADAVLAASKMAYEAIIMLEDPRIIKAVCNYMSAVYDGQKLDLSVGNDALGVPVKADIVQIYERKTCALIQAACVAGVLSAKGSNSAIKNAAAYGYNLGMAFQLIDDILDNENSENARAEAEKYTKEALALLENVPNNAFLVELTKNLLDRKN
ncbi:MAG: polyprenyl synthetase family protein [Oscillospiraceae bacterium]|nr:polyprenyl synthetase family protein [Oscillospiraceae bacterium]